MLGTDQLNYNTTFFTLTFHSCKLCFESFLSTWSFFLFLFDRKAKFKVPSFFILNNDSWQIRFHQNPLLLQYDSLLLAVVIFSIWKRKISQKTHFLSCLIYEINKNIRNDLILIHCNSHGLFDIPSTKSINCLLIISFHLKMTTFYRYHVGFVLFVQIYCCGNFSCNLKEQFFLFW